MLHARFDFTEYHFGLARAQADASSLSSLIDTPMIRAEFLLTCRCPAAAGWCADFAARHTYAAPPSHLLLASFLAAPASEEMSLIFLDDARAGAFLLLCRS